MLIRSVIAWMLFDMQVFSSYILESAKKQVD